MKQLLTALLLLVILNVEAQIINGNPSNYLTALESLSPGDTLLLASGDYTDLLNINNINGTASQPIVIMGSGYSTSFLANSCCNTVSITKSSFITLKAFKIDGQNLAVDGVKAEGTIGNWAHHIVLDSLLIVGHGVNQQTVGISTKCPAWDWLITGCTIDAAGTGIYLGNSDGERPFVNGIIEYNLIKNTLGYNLQVKHQNIDSRNIDGMTLNGKTIIRHNVLSKESNASTGGNVRPNLLVGNFPASGDGSNDYYEIYGNFIWQNPAESLFQGTGNIAFYNNICVNNAGGYGITIQSQNSFEPRDIRIFNNTIISDVNWGIRLLDTDVSFQKYLYGNAVFSDHQTPIRIVGGGVATVNLANNITDAVSAANEYVNNSIIDIETIDLYPITGSTLNASLIPNALFNSYTDFSIDFNRENKLWNYRGAYSGEGTNNGWQLAVEMKPKPIPLMSNIIENQVFDDIEIQLSPNPASDFVYLSIGEPLFAVNISIHAADGQVIFQQHFNRFQKMELNTSNLEAGLYFVLISTKDSSTMLKLIK